MRSFLALFPLFLSGLSSFSWSAIWCQITCLGVHEHGLVYLLFTVSRCVDQMHLQIASTMRAEVECMAHPTKRRTNAHAYLINLLLICSLLLERKLYRLLYNTERHGYRMHGTTTAMCRSHRYIALIPSKNLFFSWKIPYKFSNFPCYTASGACGSAVGGSAGYRVHLNGSRFAFSPRHAWILSLWCR